MMTKNNSNTKKFTMIFSSLEELVPQDHKVRQYEKTINWTFIYPLVQHLYSPFGAPSIDPVILFKMVMLNYLEGIHSMRKTCERIQLDIGLRWFLGLDIEDKVPDHSTWSQNYIRKYSKEPQLVQSIFNHILNDAYENNFIDCENIYADGTHIKACANRKKSKGVVVRETTKAYMDDLINDINEDRLNHGKKLLKNNNDDEDDTVPPRGGDTLLKTNDSEDIIDKVKNEKGKVTSYKVMNLETGEIEERKVNKGYKEIKESLVDPDSGFYHKGEHEKQFAYVASAACDSNGYILACHTDSGNKHDSTTFFDLYPKIKQLSFWNEIKNMALDAAYRTPAIAKTVLDDDRKIITPYVSPKTKEGFFKKYDFVYDEYYDCYLCPENQILDYSTTNKSGYKEYKSNPLKCATCPSKNKCTESKNNEKVVCRHVWEDYLETAHDIRHTIGSSDIYAKRKETIERVFADAKENSCLRFTRYRGLKRVSFYTLLSFACHNLKKMAKWKFRLGII